MLDLLAELRKKVAIGFVGGSNFAKISEQLALRGHPGACTRPLLALTLFTDVPSQ
jgi:hypothetical protein